jgi:hypothetical protein
VSGARKVTDYLGRYLLDNYDIEDQRVNASYAGWYADYEEYTRFKNETLSGQNDIVNYLMLLSGDDINVAIDIKNKDIFSNALIMALLENDGVDVDNISGNTDFIIIKDGGKSSIILDDFKENGRAVDTPLGNVYIEYDELLEGYTLYVDDDEFVYGSVLEDADMHICVWRNGTVIDDVRFFYTVSPEDTAVAVSRVDR